MNSILLALLLAAPAPGPGEVQDILVFGSRDRPFMTPAVPNRVLARMRGGIRLPNGFDVAIGIDIQTRVNDLLVLHTIYASDGPMAGVRVYTDGPDGDRLAPGTVTVTAPSEPGSPSVTVDRSPTGTTIFPGATGGPSVVNLVNGDPGTWLNANGQTLVPVTENGPGVTQGPGTFRLATDDRGAIVTLDGQMLQVQHLVGQATGIAIANTADNRSIDTISSINIDLQGGLPVAMSGLFVADRLAFEAMGGR